MSRRFLGAIAVSVATAFGAAACVADPPPVTIDDPELVEGREVYARNCASCHGADGGGGLGRKLSDGAVIAAYPDVADQIDLIVEGRGTMPAYQARLSEAQIQAVTRYTREIL